MCHRCTQASGLPKNGFGGLGGLNADIWVVGREEVGTGAAGRRGVGVVHLVGGCDVASIG